MQRLSVSAAVVGDPFGGFRRTGERDLVHVGMFHKSRPSFAESGHDVDHTRRKPGFDRQFSHREAGQRRLFGRFHDDRVPRRQGRSPLPGRHQHREIPGNDLTANADRFAAGVAEIIAPDRDRATFDLVGPTAVIPQTINHER